MSFKIVSRGQTVSSTEIDFNTIVQMVQNFVDKTYKKLGPGDPVKVSPHNDSHAVYYDKAALDDLFASNGYDPDAADADQYGLRVYLGLHTHSPLEDAAMPDRPESYIGQHTVILVCTKNEVDLLNTGNVVAIYVKPGTGVEEGQICPPPACGAVDGGLH